MDLMHQSDLGLIAFCFRLANVKLGVCTGRSMTSKGQEP